MKKALTFLLPLLCLFCQLAYGQLDLRLEPVRHDFVTGEGAALNLTITNNTDTNQKFDNNSGKPWLSVMVFRAGMDTPVSPLAIAKFPALTIPAGARKAFQINLKDFYRLDITGNYRAVATIRMPNSSETYSSNRALFSMIPGGDVRTFQVQARGRRLNMSVRLAKIEGHNDLFGQVIDRDSNHVVGACFMARYLNFMKPIVKLDAAQNLHVLCQSSPEFFTHSVMSPQGERTHYQLYKRTAGPVDLVGGGKGLTPVGVAPYVPSKEKKVVYPKASERVF